MFDITRKLEKKEKLCNFLSVFYLLNIMDFDNKELNDEEKELFIKEYAEVKEKYNFSIWKLSKKTIQKNMKK